MATRARPPPPGAGVFFCLNFYIKPKEWFCRMEVFLVSNPRVCPVCGYQLLENENVCIICGKRFDNSASEPKKQEPVYAKPQQEYESSSPVRTYTTSRQPQSTPTRTYTTSSGMGTDTTNTNGKKKMSPILKVFLIFFGIQFVIPIIMGIVMLVVFFFQFGSVEKQINEIVNADVGVVDVDEIKIKPEDCTNITPYDNGVTGDVLMMSDDHIIYVPVELDDGEYETHVFLDIKEWDSLSYTKAGVIKLSNNISNTVIKFYLPDETDSHPINSIDFNASQIEISRYDDIDFGGDVFQTYKYNGTYYFICELSEDYYISCEVDAKASVAKDDIHDLFPLAAISKH